MKKKIALTVCFILLGLAVYTMLYFGIYTEFTADWNTVYSKGFTKENINKIQNNMTRQEVINILGEPFRNETNCMHYSKGKTGIQVIPPFAGDFWYTSATVCFDENGKATGVILHKFFN